LIFRMSHGRRDGAQEHWSGERDEDTRRITANSVAPVLEAGACATATARPSSPLSGLRCPQ
jgi:hypothetical protein